MYTIDEVCVCLWFRNKCEETKVYQFFLSLKRSNQKNNFKVTFLINSFSSQFDKLMLTVSTKVVIKVTQCTIAIDRRRGANRN